MSLGPEAKAEGGQMREVVGDGWLEPVHPVPHPALRSQVAILRSARRDLLSAWREADYDSTIVDFELLGRQMVIVNTPEGVRHVMTTHNNDVYERKGPQMRRALEFLLGDGLFISDGETWARRRPLVAEIVGKARVPRYGPAMAAAAQEMAADWASRDPAEPVDVLSEMGVLTAEIISRTLFGVRLGRDDARRVIDAFADYARRIDSFNVGYLLGFDEGLPVFKGLALRRAVRRIHGVVDRVIEDHLAGRGDHTVMLDMLEIRKQRRPDSPVGRDALRDEAATLFMAGHETTAATLAWAWHCLSKAPWAEAALHAEVAAVCGDRPVAYEDVFRLNYARAIVEETLRLYPPVPILARQAARDDRIGEVTVKKASVVLVSPWLLHRSPDLWEHPDRFMPERFIEEDRPETYAYLPFAAGPRTCPGMTFGLTEATLCLAALAQRFRLRPAPGWSVETECRLSLRPRGGLRMLVEPRKSASG